MRPSTDSFDEAFDDLGSGSVLGFLQTLWELAHTLKSSSKRMHATLGVTGPQRLLLRVLAQAGGIASPGQLARALHVDPSSLTGVLRRLEHAKLVKRTPHPLDGRRAIIALTARGKGLAAQRAGTVETAARQVLKALSASEIRAIQEALGALAREIGAEKTSAAKLRAAPDAEAKRTPRLR